MGDVVGKKIRTSVLKGRLAWTMSCWVDGTGIAWCFCSIVCLYVWNLRSL